MARYYSVTTVIHDEQKYDYVSGSTEVEADTRPQNTVTEHPRKTIYVDYFDSYEEAEQFVNDNQQ